jgi:hypothetical protein
MAREIGRTAAENVFPGDARDEILSALKGLLIERHPPNHILIDQRT